MACYHPLNGYRAQKGGGIAFSHRDGWKDRPMQVACGQCLGCRLERQRSWATRILHEASLHDENCFLTLTYDDTHLPEDRSLSKRDLQLFLKRLRKRQDGKIRYYAVGEYGGRYGRPHYHLCLFGYDPADKRYLSTRAGHKVFVSEEVQRTWPLGMHEVGSLTASSAKYVAGYVLKKVRNAPGCVTVSVVDSDSGEVFAVAPEFATMSRRPGIGRGWIEKFHEDIYPGAEVVVDGKPFKAPEYYTRLLAEKDPELVEGLKVERRKRRKRVDETPERLAVREKVAEANLQARTVF